MLDGFAVDDGVLESLRERLRCSDPRLPAEDIALGYKQLLEVERGWRDMKTTLDLRPVFHRREDRIRAHVLLCWLALLLARIVETQAGTPDTPTTWPRARASFISSSPVSWFTSRMPKVR